MASVTSASRIPTFHDHLKTMVYHMRTKIFRLEDDHLENVKDKHIQFKLMKNKKKLAILYVTARKFYVEHKEDLTNNELANFEELFKIILKDGILIK
jgi:hypothetical protein